MTAFHSDDYVDFLRNITPDNMQQFVKQLHMFNVGEDCPVFDGMYEFCQISAGGSIGASRRAARRDALCLLACARVRARR